MSTNRAFQKSKRDLLSVLDFSRDQIFDLILLAQAIKKNPSRYAKTLVGKTLAMLLQKPSTRTSVSFAVGMVELGGFPLILNPQDLQMKRGETIADTAKVFSRFVSGIMLRANHHEDAVALAQYASIPIISGLTDKEHPCQVFSDLLTLVEAKKLKHPRDLKKLTLAYLGDGNNMTHSWLLAAGLLGMEIRVASPKKYSPEKFYIGKALELAAKSGGKILLEHDPQAAARNADVLYTDVWTSMGKEQEHDVRAKVLAPYQLNAKVLAVAKKNVSVLHCLPAHRGEEISADVMDGPNSIVFDQAENRLHMQKAILIRLLKS